MLAMKRAFFVFQMLTFSLIVAHLFFGKNFYNSKAYASENCVYRVSVWNSKLRRVSKTRLVNKDYRNLSPKEKGAKGCTPCERDQKSVRLSNGVEFRMCHVFADKVQNALNQSLKRGFSIDTVVGYRPSMSRGPLDGKGNRTQLSQHAFGVAIDVNSEANGLYNSCKNFHPKRCRLVKGGHYQPEKNPKAILKDSFLVGEMQRMGWKWGGERSDSLKDFMHFSPDGL